MKVTRMKLERLKRGWTLEEVGTKVGVTKQMIHNIETQKCKPSYDLLVKLQDLFNLYRCDLLQQTDGDESSFSSPYNSNNESK